MHRQSTANKLEQCRVVPLHLEDLGRGHSALRASQDTVESQQP